MAVNKRGENIMQIPQRVKENLIELSRTIKEFQIRHDLICDTLADTAGITGVWQIKGDYDEITAAPGDQLTDKHIKVIKG